MEDSKCKKCRRAGVKLFLKGEKCFSVKCPVVRKPYPPGPKGKRRIKTLSEYGKELKEKQKLRNWYNLSERQFRQYIKKALEARGRVEDASVFLIQILEKRLDNVVFRLGFVPSRTAGRQVVSHRHILVNNRRINISSFLVKKGDVVKIYPISVKKSIFQNLPQTLKKYTPPAWLKLDAEKLEGKVLGEPNFVEAAPPAEIASIFEYYSR